MRKTRLGIAVCAALCGALFSYASMAGESTADVRSNVHVSIRKVSDHFDVAFFPIDGRIGNGYTLGGRQFIDRFQVGLFVPMHFVASGFESAWRFKEFSDAKGISLWCIRQEGESFEIE